MGAAAFRFCSEERKAVAFSERGQHRSAWLIGLQKRAAWPFCTARPASHLAHELKSALPGAQITARKAEIRINNADEREARKVVALCCDLSGDKNFDGA